MILPPGGGRPPARRRSTDGPQVGRRGAPHSRARGDPCPSLAKSSSPKPRPPSAALPHPGQCENRVKTPRTLTGTGRHSDSDFVLGSCFEYVLVPPIARLLTGS